MVKVGNIYHTWILLWVKINTIQKKGEFFPAMQLLLLGSRSWLLVAMNPILCPRAGAGRYQVGPETMKGSPLEMAIVPETPLPPEPCHRGGGWKLTKSWYSLGMDNSFKCKIKRSTVTQWNHLTSKKHVNQIGSSTEVMMEKPPAGVQMLVTHVSACHRSLQRIHRRFLGCSQLINGGTLWCTLNQPWWNSPLPFIQKHWFHGYGHIYTLHIYLYIFIHNYKDSLLTHSMMNRNDDSHKSSKIKQSRSTIMSAFFDDINNIDINNIDHQIKVD